MNKWKQIAVNALGGNNPAGNRTRIKIDDLIAAYPDGVTINGVAMAQYKGETYPMFFFAEDDTRYFTGGMALNNMVNAWLEEDPALAEVNDWLAREGLKVNMCKVRTKSGNTYTRVDTDKDPQDFKDEPNVDADTDPQDFKDEPNVDAEMGEVAEKDPF